MRGWLQYVYGKPAGRQFLIVIVVAVVVVVAVVANMKALVELPGLVSGMSAKITERAADAQLQGRGTYIYMK